MRRVGIAPIILKLGFRL